MNNRILAMLLAIIMIIGIVPVTADAACKHADYTTFAAKEATCTTDGNVEYYKCNNCGARSLQKNFKQIVEDTSILYTKATGHSRKWVVTDSEHYQICEKCDDIVVSSKGNHSLKATNNGETHDLDCTVEGCPYEVKAAAHVDGSVKDCKCGYCGAIMHDLKLVEAKAATCTETGMKAYYACENCVAKFDAETKEQTTTAALTTEKVEHDASWEITETEHRKYCKNCNATHLAKENHTFSYKDNEDGTHTKSCKTCEYSVKVEHVDTDKNCVCDYTECSAALNHVYEGWKNDVDGHWHKCTNANCAKSFDWAKHTYTYQANEGKHTHTETCTICNKVKETQPCFDKDGDHFCDGCKAVIRHGFTDAEVMRKSATCTEAGFKAHYQCATCKVLFVKDGSVFVPTTAEAVALAPLGHKARAAISCDATSHYNLCDNTGCTEKLNVEEHKLKYAPNDANTHYAQCEVCGSMPAALKFVKHVDENKDCKCDVCEFANDHKDTSKMTYVEYLAATCTTDGHTDYYVCGNCQGKFLSDGSAWDPFLKALGHDWVYKYDTLSGKHVVKCKNCKAYETQDHTDTNDDCLCDIGECNALIHSHEYVIVAKVEPTCTEPGTEAYLMYAGCGKKFDSKQNPISAPAQIAATGHDWSGEWVGFDKDQHAKECAKCDEMQFEDHVDANMNNYCDVCEASLALKYVAKVEPTCTNVGYEAYWVSEITDRKYADEAGTTQIANPEQIAALGHDLSKVESNGVGGHVYSCSRCAHTETENHSSKVNECFCDVCGQVISGHKLTSVAAKAATCTASGIQAYTVCDCGLIHDLASGEIVKAPVVIPALGHQWESEWFNDARENGHSKYCVRTGCNEKLTVEHTLEVEDTLKGNMHQWFCTSCNYIETGIHTNKDGDNLCDECGHNSATVVTENSLNNNKQSVTVKVEKVENEKNALTTWFDNFVGKFNPSYSGESNSSSAPSASVGSSVPSSGSGNGSGTSSGSTASGSSTTTSTTGTSAINGLIQWLASLLNALLGA